MRFRIFALCALAAACSSDDTISSDASIDQTSDQANDATKTDGSSNDATSAPDVGSDATTNDASIDSPEDVAVDSPEDASADAIEEVITLDAGGCTVNSQCSNADYCAKANADCNGIGSCMMKPQFCPQIAFPVCGCNKKTYVNSCYANQAGENVAYNGSCE